MSTTREAALERELADCRKAKRELGERLRTMETALQRITRYDEQPLWMDSVSDCADFMLSIARVALGEEEEE